MKGGMGGGERWRRGVRGGDLSAEERRGEERRGDEGTGERR